MEHRHRRIGRTYYWCPTAQARSSPLHCSRRLGAHAHGIHCHSQGGDCTGPLPHRCFSRIRMAATATATRHPRTCRWRGAYAAQQARKELCTEKPSPPAGPHTATIRCPTDCPVCGKHCSCRTSVVTHMVNAHGITRSQALREFGFRGESEPPEIPPEPPPST
ncbi:hypothetical protein C3747_16g103 [Trypanosoma cruzi]|uniref:C2H2-type domain-containing protein n=1 Tax=Trypanosoma cruzi TaxID=5693 RepID=A0A2V2XCH3_TRYCR|nr:hypothetical protein C3747_16g103 [Trypanosoma cruzi]